MKIALVSPLFPPVRGGVEKHVYHLSAELAARGHSVTVFTQAASSPRMWRTPGDVEVQACPIRFGGNAYPVAPTLWTRLLRAGGMFDIVHAHSYHGLAALAASVSYRGPFVFTPHYHGTGHTGFARSLHRVYSPLGKAVFARASQVICVSDAERMLVVRDHPAVAPKSVVVPNGLTTQVVTEPRAWGSRRKNVVYVGRLEPYKRVDLIIAAMSELPADVKLVIVGVGSDRGRLTSEFIRLELADRVRLVGAQPDGAVAQILARAGVVVTASEHEAFGLILLEARQAGARVVASALAAHREVAQLDLAGGIHIWEPETGTSGLAAAIHTALAADDPGLLKSAPRWPDVATATELIYQRALAGS
jgi:glycosyltransferase involved in cell wall biosynthesis